MGTCGGQIITRMRLFAVAAALFVLVGAPAALRADDSDPTRAAKALVDLWVDVQNRGDFAAYSALYASGFTGVRRSGTRTVKMDRAGWLRERERMFQKKPTVVASEVRITPAADGTTTVELEQRWQSTDYGDVGKKRLTLVTEDNKLRIAFEEMLSSKRIVVPGERVELHAPMRSLAVAQEIEAGLTAIVAQLSGDSTHLGPFASSTSRAENSPPRIWFGVCEGDAAKLAERFFKELVPGLEVLPSKREVNCPFANDPGDGDYPAGTWDWPEPKVIAVGKNSLVVFVFQYDEDQPGDFARAFRYNLVLAVLRDPRGRVLDHATEHSESDYSPLESVEVKDGKVVVTEKDIDNPCDGSDRHRYREYARKYTVGVGAKDSKVNLKTSRKLITVDRCSDDEAQIYRDAQRRTSK